MLQALLYFARQLYCRHEYVTRFEHSRMSLHCLHCGRQTPGFEVDRCKY